MSEVDQRPLITEYTDILQYVRDMLAFRKKREAHFSILQETRKLRRISPTLVSLVLKRKRRISLDRVGEMSKLLGLNVKERCYLSNWVNRLEKPEVIKDAMTKISPPPERRKEVSSHILQDWINVYVKDCFQIPEVQRDPSLIFKILGHLASRKRLLRAVNFLIREGYLRKTIEGLTVVETPLVVSDKELTDQKVRRFHKGALDVARSAIELHSTSERYANALIIPLSENKYQELVELIQGFAENLKNFAENNDPPGGRLYQLIVNLSPTGSK